MANSALIKSLENIMRIDDGVDGDSQYIGQITWMLFLKAFDAKEMEWEFKPDYKGIIPVGYRWRDWADDKEGITGDALIKFVGELFEKLKKLDTSDGDMRKFVVRSVFEDINNYMKSGIQLRKLINAINEKVDFNDAREKHTFNELYEGMLRDLQSAGQAGEYYTPRPVTNFIVEKVDPKLGEVVLDPACGTGGFLTSTIAHFGSIKSTEELATLQKSITGWEKKPLPYLLAMTNLILHDIEIPALRHQNSLSKPLSDYSSKDRVDVIVANPPFGGAEDKSVKNNFPTEFQTSETADLFMALIMHLLKDKGRCGIVLPDSFMFDDGVKATIKEKLLKEYGLHTIIRLPQVFKPYASVNTNLLFFQKGVSSDGVWFYRLDYPEGVKSFTKTKPIQDKHFDPVRKWWDDKRPLIIDGKDKARFYTVDELAELNYNFDKCCPFPQKEEEILEPAELIARCQCEYTMLNNSFTNVISWVSDTINGVKPSEVVLRKNIISKLLKLNSEFPIQLRKSVLQYAIQGKLTNRERSDEPASELLKRIHAQKTRLTKEGKTKKEKILPAITDDEKPFDIPSSWEWIRLGDIGIWGAGATPSKSNAAFYTNGTIPWLVTGDLNDGVITEIPGRITELALEKTSVKLNPANSVLIAMYGATIGKVGLLTFPATTNQACCACNPVEGIDLWYLMYFLMSQRSAFIKRGEGGAQPNISKEKIIITPMPLPPLAEQKRIVARVEELLAVCDGLN